MNKYKNIIIEDFVNVSFVVTLITFLSITAFAVHQANMYRILYIVLIWFVSLLIYLNTVKLRGGKLQNQRF